MFKIEADTFQRANRFNKKDNQDFSSKKTKKNLSEL